MKTQKKKASDRKAEILDCARHLLITEGSRALTLRGIANEIGLKLSSIQYYFPTHAELKEALVADRLTEQQVTIEQLLKQSQGSPSETLDAVLKWFTSGSSGDDRLDVQFWAMAQVDEAASRALAQYHDAYVRLFEKLIHHATGVSMKEATGRAVSVTSLLEGSILFVDLSTETAPGHNRSRDIYNSARLIAYESSKPSKSR